MANQKISGLTELAATPASGDKVEIVDVSDTTMAVTGTNKFVTYANLVSLSALGVTASATELNYVDGVTSDIQTQINGKQASGATLSSLEGLTLGAGDLLYATAADTLTDLAIGTAGQVLTVNTGATAPQWSTPSTGGTAGLIMAAYRSSNVSYDGTNTFVFNSTQTAPTVGTYSTSTGIYTASSTGAGWYLVTFTWIVNSDTTRLDVQLWGTGTGSSGRSYMGKNVNTAIGFDGTVSSTVYIPNSGTIYIDVYTGASLTFTGGSFGSDVTKMTITKL